MYDYFFHGPLKLTCAQQFSRKKGLNKQFFNFFCKECLMVMRHATPLAQILLSSIIILSFVSSCFCRVFVCNQFLTDNNIKFLLG
jgi:hypothetical protein